MITVTDTTGTLSAGARADLEATPTPFAVKATFVSTTKDALRADMAACVDTPTTVCIGVDPIHRFTHTEFGIDTGIKSGDFQQVARAGNLDFKQGNWAEGVRSIVSRGTVLSQKSSAPTAVVIQQPRTEVVVDHGVSPWPFILGFGALILVGAVLWRILRRQQLKTASAISDLHDETFEYASRNVEAMTSIGVPTPVQAFPNRVPTRPAAVPGWMQQPVSRSQARRYAEQKATPAPQVVVVDRDRGNADLVTGILLGEAMSRPAPEPYRAPAPAPTPPPRRRDTPPSTPAYSSGSSGSSFLDSFSSGGGGGGFDSFSGGGGGSDF